MKAFLYRLMFPALALMCGCGGSGESSTLARQTECASDSVTVEKSDITRQAENMADSVLRGLSLEQRVGQLFMPAIYASADELTMRQLRSYISEMSVGGVVLLKGDLSSAAVMSAECADADVPLFVSIDAEWGLGMRLKDAPNFPRNGRINPGADEDLLYDYGREVARECRRVGINMVLGPVIDVAENPRGVIGSRSFGNDPVRVADLGVAYARGLESGGVISVAKHFPGHGSPSVDSHRELPVVGRSLHQLDSIDLYPFRSYVDAGLTGVMVGHLAVPAVDPESRPAAVSGAVIEDLLKGELGFNGLVLTDALNMRGAEGYGASAAIAAGADIVVAPLHTGEEIERVVAGVRSGALREETVNERCKKILFHKILLGLWNREELSLDSLREDVRGASDTLSRRLLSN